MNHTPPGKPPLTKQSLQTTPEPAGKIKSGTGTQAIERAIHLLKLLGTRGRFGWGLTELSRRSELDKATVRRILACLESERLVDRDFRDHRYLPGPLLIELGLSVFPYQPFLDECRGSIARLSRSTGGASFVYLRSGHEAVVAGRMEETFHKGMINDVGYRRPMISSAGGIAILLALPARERAAIVRQNIEELTRTGTNRPERFKKMLERSIEMGFAVNLEDVAPGINSFALSVPGQTGAPIASLSVAGPPGLFPVGDTERFAKLLTKEVANLSRRVGELFPDRGMAHTGTIDEDAN